MDRLSRKFDRAREILPAPVLRGSGKERVGIVAYGSSDPAIRESQDQLRAEAGLATDYLRVRAWPFARGVLDFVAAHDRVYVVEQNRDGQLCALLKLDLPADQVTHLRGIAHVSGLPLDARSVTDEILAKERS
jgi:2-oxoglutarate ferredoxin oxidoreductase subunit alpha